MKARVYETETDYRDVELRDAVTEIQRIYVGKRILDAVGDTGEVTTYRRTHEVEDGRVVFR